MKNLVENHIKVLKEIEENYKVEDIKYYNIPLWPFLRLSYYFSFFEEKKVKKMLNNSIKIYLNYIFYAYKSHILAIITFVVGILNVPITFYLVKLNGEVGAAQGFLIVNILSFLFTWVISAKVYPMNWRKGIFYAFHNK